MIIEEHRRAELAAHVKLVLTSAGISSKSFVRTICDVLEISRPQAYRKLNGEVDFTLPQIAALEHKFGVQILLLAEVPTGDAPGHSARSWVPALLRVDGLSVPCHAIVGPAWQSTSDLSFSCYLERGRWNVCLSVSAPADTPLFEVTELAWLARGERKAATEPSQSDGARD